MAIREEYGWVRYASGDTSLWFNGHLHGADPGSLVIQASELLDAPGDDVTERWLQGLDGHFALVAEKGDRALAATDRVRSIPLFYAKRPDGRLAFDSAAWRLADAAGLGPAQIDDSAALCIGMSGYTIGTDTLYRELDQLAPAEFVIVDQNAAKRRRYAAYHPWQESPREGTALRDELVDRTGAILDKLIDGADGRPIAIPLSAGVDSRLITSGLADRGYRNVLCFAYGRPDSHEAVASRSIAGELGFPWTFVRYTPARQRAYFRGSLFSDYFNWVDSCCSTPNTQDLPAIFELKERGWLPPDALIVNGQSGDFITGNHIPPKIIVPDPMEARELLFEALIEKHFSLWKFLKTPANLRVVRNRLQREIDQVAALLPPNGSPHGLFEYCEFQDRQSKYVISGQRVYDYLGFGWRLPLWDTAYLDFWEQVPLEAKLGQRLYRSTFIDLNWGGVWGPDWPINKLAPSPWWVWALRGALLPLGRSGFNRAYKRFARYWIEPNCAYGIVPWHFVALDRRGDRHAVSWATEAYLGRKGIDLERLGQSLNPTAGIRTVN